LWPSLQKAARCWRKPMNAKGFVGAAGFFFPPPPM